MLWKIKQPKDGVYSVVRCVQFTVRLFGYWPFDMGNRPTEIGSVKRILQKISTIFWYTWSTILVSSYAYYIYKQRVFRGFWNPIERIPVQELVLLLTSFFSIHMDVLNTDRIRETITTFNEFDAEVWLLSLSQYTYLTNLLFFRWKFLDSVRTSSDKSCVILHSYCWSLRSKHIDSSIILPYTM